MKRIFVYLMVLTSMFTTSCGLFGDDETDYESVYNGLVMYFASEQTTTRAMDGINVAMRLSILISEMETAGIDFDGSTEPDWSQLGDIRYGGLDYNKKFFLFGADNGISITKDGNNYFVNYGTESGSHTAGTSDMCYRLGEYKIATTTGSNILDSSESAPWNITLNSDVVSFAALKSSVIPYFECAEADAKLWYIGDGEFGYSVSNAELIYVYYDDDDLDDYDYSDWSLSGTFSIDNFSVLSIEDTINTDFYQTSEGGGVAINGYTYYYNTLSPVVYNFLSGANTKYGGVEEVTRSTGRYVMVETSSDGIQTINYNGNTYDYDAEYYYFYYYEYYNSVDVDDDDDDDDDDDE